MNGIIFNIQRYCINDGDGIRTTVFLKGCPLNCLWCHNPESKSQKPQIIYTADKCLSCMECEKACTNDCHKEQNGLHIFDRNSCTACGECVKMCPSALELCGKSVSTEQVMETVLKDEAFYGKDGGMTVSGGEPFLQPDFLIELLKSAKERGINTCIETSGFTSTENIAKTLPYVDTYLFDYKESDENRHREYVGVSNKQILENLEFLNDNGARLVLRCPIIPKFNDRDDHFSSIGEITCRYKNIIRVDVEPYHPLGASKAENLGLAYPLKDLGFPTDETVAAWIDKIKKYAACPVGKA